MAPCPPPPTTSVHEDANTPSSLSTPSPPSPSSSPSPSVPLKSLVWMTKGVKFCGRRDCKKCNLEMQKQKHFLKKDDEDGIRTISIEDDSCLLDCTMSHGCLKYPTQALSLKNSYGCYPKDISNSGEETKKAVHWGIIAIHSHAMMLGDNPPVCFGPPVTIAWDAMESDTLQIDEFEKVKAAYPPRQRLEMVLPSRMREDLLIRDGYARSEMRAAVREAQRIRVQRAKSAHDYSWDTPPSEILRHLLHLSMPRSGDHGTRFSLKPRSTAGTGAASAMHHHHQHHHHHNHRIIPLVPIW